ncbi:MAG: four helix bundle protein, partial [Marinirhabdus sp.]
MAKNFEDLKCWQACQEFKIYLKNEVLTELPSDEKYDLYNQIRRASRSATANIAEGYGRYYPKDQIKYLVQARGSVTEILDHIIETR